jgi:predicted RND superfamily exporter protein
VKWLVKFLSSSVSRAPKVVLASALAITIVLLVFVPQQEQASGNEGFSPDSAEFVAIQKIDELFSDNSEVAVQIVIDGDAGDILTAEGLRTYVTTRQAIDSSRATELMVGRPEGDVVGFFDPTLQAMQAQGVDPLAASDEQVKQFFLGSFEQLPPEVQELFGGLLGASADLDEPSARAGLMVVFLNLSVLEDDPDQAELQAIQLDMAEKIDEATEGFEVTAEPFSFALLFSNQDEFQSEIGRLFGTAFMIIVAILLVVLWIGQRVTVGNLANREALRAAIVIGLVPLAIVALISLFADVAGTAFGMAGGAGVGLGIYSFFAVKYARWRRTNADMLLAMAVIVMSIIWMNGFGVLLGPGYLGVIGPFSEFLQILPILLIGLGVDYAIHLTARYREEIGSGKDVIAAAVRASRTVGVALILATVTTAVGFLTNIWSPVTAISDFGILAAVGIGSAFALMLTFVPSVRILLDRRAQEAGRLPSEAMGQSENRFLPKLMGAASVFARRAPAVMVLIALTLGGFGAWGWANLETRFSFIDFVPEGSELLTTYDTITEEFAGGFGERTQVLVEGDDLGTPDAHNALALAQQNMADTPDVLTFAGRAQAESPLSVIAQLTTPPEAGGDPTLFDGEFAAVAAELGLQQDLTVGPDADVTGIYDAAAASAPEAMRRVAVKEDGVYRYIDVSVATQAGEQGAAGLRDGLGEDFAPLDSLEGVTAVATNENIVSRGVVEAIQSSQVWSLFLTIGAAMLLLIVNFWVEVRRPALGVLTMLPVALVVLWVFGAMALSGIPFNPVTAMIASIAIGIGVPYTIHVTHRFQEDRVRCETPSEAIKSTMTHTGGALAGSAFTTVAGFGILVTSSLKPFQQFGEVVAYAIGFAMLGAVLVLPSLLVLWDRWHRRRGDVVLEGFHLEEMFAE